MVHYLTSRAELHTLSSDQTIVCSYALTARSPFTTHGEMMAARRKLDALINGATTPEMVLEELNDAT